MRAAGFKKKALWKVHPVKPGPARTSPTLRAGPHVRSRNAAREAASRTRGTGHSGAGGAGGRRRGRGAREGERAGRPGPAMELYLSACSKAANVAASKSATSGLAADSQQCGDVSGGGPGPACGAGRGDGLPNRRLRASRGRWGGAGAGVGRRSGCGSEGSRGPCRRGFRAAWQGRPLGAGLWAPVAVAGEE